MKRKSNSRSTSSTSETGTTHKHSVSEAKRLESGQVTVMGTIDSVSTLYKMITKSEWRCDNLQCTYSGSQKFNPPLLLPITLNLGVCPKCKSSAFRVTHSYQNARTLQLEDIDKTEADDAAADMLEVVVFGDAPANISAGEPIDVVGDLHVEPTLDSSGRGKRLVTILHSNELTYKHKKEIVLTNKDLETFKRHKQICDAAHRRELEASNRNETWSKEIVPMSYVDRVVAMFAPNVIGHNNAKLGLLRSLVGGNADSGGGNDNGRRGRSNTMLVGDPGTAKSQLAREATKILPNSRYVTAQNASGKSLVAIVDKINDTRMLRLGAAVLSKGAICAINEFGAMSMEDQQHLTDIAEEG